MIRLAAKLVLVLMGTVDVRVRETRSERDLELMQFGSFKMLLLQQNKTEKVIEQASSRKQCNMCFLKNLILVC